MLSLNEMCILKSKPDFIYLSPESVIAPTHGGNIKLPLEPFLIISRCCKEPCTNDSNNQLHTEPWEDEDRPVLFSQPADSVFDAAVVVCCFCDLARACDGSTMIQWCCDFNSGAQDGLFSSDALWVTVQSSLGRPVKPVRLRNERRWGPKT